MFATGVPRGARGEKMLGQIHKTYHPLGGWRWLEQRLVYREMMQRERQKSEEEAAQFDFLFALGPAA